MYNIKDYIAGYPAGQFKHPVSGGISGLILLYNNIYLSLLGTDIKFCIDMYARKGDFQLRRYVRDYYGTENKSGDSIIFILAGTLA